MKYPSFIRATVIVLVVLSATFFAGCSAINPQNDTSRVKIWHVVIVRLKNPGDADAQKKLLEAAQTLRQIKVVRALYAGKVVPGNRPHVDSNFDVAISIGFESEEDMAAYVKDPIHIKAVTESLLPVTKDYTIYDFQNE